eukprot:CAMPEP_0197862158 /NCGR_PEP_ID=MMETSP1438-20131217/38722_1 /TAXON_ID=1461541 /ORGANISM="Pterosperma sp., Strain CCMP1384" /LENGTH=94 /DNA_ID=CAMNT_0043479619 /DNA_START=232 /DNA_END=513 /DNA_ORIENTATION=-
MAKERKAYIRRANRVLKKLRAYRRAMGESEDLEPSLLELMAVVEEEQGGEQGGEQRQQEIGDAELAEVKVTITEDGTEGDPDTLPIEETLRSEE